jgi:hypothetical protein
MNKDETSFTMGKMKQQTRVFIYISYLRKYTRKPHAYINLVHSQATHDVYKEKKLNLLKATP